MITRRFNTSIHTSNIAWAFSAGTYWVMYALIIAIAMQTSGLGGGGASVGITSQVIGKFRSLDECKAVAAQPYAAGGSISEAIVATNSGLNWYCVPAGSN
jgi:hypothetical protein